MELQEKLQNYGLSNKEAKLYLAALTLGTASITQLSKKANLKRPTTYLIIESLLDKSLLIAVPQGKKIYYRPEEPSQLSIKLDNKKRLIEEIAPELQSLYLKSTNQPKIRFYEGKDKLYQVYEEVFHGKEVWAMVSVDRFLELFTEEDNRHFFRIITRQGGIIYDLLEDTKKSQQFAQAKYRKGLSEVKFLPKEIRIETDFLVFDHKVVIISLSNVVGVIIEDKGIADTVRIMLQSMWGSR
jgi:sugar-specific transcriptional regulator TrmB